MLDIVCRECGTRNRLVTGTTSHSVSMVKCPYCGYRQPGGEICIKCGADMAMARTIVTHPKEPEKVERGVLSRRYKILTITAVFMILMIFLGSLAGVFFMMRSSDAYKASEEFIRNNKEIKNVVGDNLKFGLIPRGSIRSLGEKGAAEFKVRVKGTRGKTTVRVFLKKKGDTWYVATAIYEDNYGVRRRVVPVPEKQGGSS